MSMRTSARFGFVLQWPAFQHWLSSEQRQRSAFQPPRPTSSRPANGTITIPSLPVSLPTVAGLPIATTGTTTTADPARPTRARGPATRPPPATEMAAQ